MLVLAIETAIGPCSAAVLKDGNVIAEITSEESNKQAELLPETVNKVMANSGTSIDDLDRIAINIGPGSFTGIRIGLAFAEGLATAKNIPLVAVTSLEAIALNFSGELIVVQEAMRGDCYFQKMNEDRAEMIKWSDLPLKLNPDCQVISTNPEKVPNGNWKIYENPVFPTAVNIGIIALRKKTSQPIPFYIRPPDARPQQIQS